VIKINNPFFLFLFDSKAFGLDLWELGFGDIDPTNGGLSFH